MSTPFFQTEGSPAGFVRPRLVALTGIRGSGKSAFGDLLAKKGRKVIDTDLLAHEILDLPCEAYFQVLQRFGHDLVATAGGPIDRKLLRERTLLAGGNGKADLEAIMHPAIAKLLESKIQELALAGVKVVFIQVPLLHESGWAKHFDAVWCVVASGPVVLKRVMDRDGVDEATARKLIAQHKFSQDEKAKGSDRIIDNSTDFVELEAQADQLLAEVDAILEDTVSTTPPTEPEVTPPNTTAPVTSDNARLQETLRTCGRAGTDEVIERLGDVTTTGHKSGRAEFSVNVDACDGEHTGEDHKHAGRKVKVDVIMSVQNTHGKTNTDGCSCGCGDNCRVSCACQADCGCSCKKPTPPPPPPDECHHKHTHSRQWLYALLALFGLLAFLFAAIVFWRMTHEPEITIINQVPCCPEDPVKPPVTPEDPKDPFKPPTPPPDEKPPVVQPTTKEILDEVPGYAFRYVHNSVRVKVASWEESKDKNGTTLRGYDADGKLLLHQVYDTHDWHMYQYVCNYHPNGSIHIDRFEGRLNRFVGRTIYTYNQYGTVERAEFLDGLQGRVRMANFSRTASGALGALYVTQYDPRSSVETGKNVVEGYDSVVTYLGENFYVYTWFQKIK